MNEPRWLQAKAVLAIHSRQLTEHGGMAGVRDPGLFDSALARHRNLFAYGQPPPDLALLAAAYAYGLIKNHPFVDGNKRTAYVACRTFLKINGQDFEAPDVEKYQTVIRLADGTLSESEFAEWLRQHSS
jgi:death-on-curing protein